MKAFIRLFPVVIIIFFSCQGKPKVIQPVSETSGSASAVSEVEDPKDRIHEVTVNEFMHASRYTYLNVTEGDKDFWIAIPYTEVEKGDKYYYKGGVLMYNFESKEHNRVFETLYLVSGVSKTPNLDTYATGYYPALEDEEELAVQSIDPIAGGTSISDLFSDPRSFSGKTITIKGQCVKVNRNIMGRNWVHIQDGGKGNSDTNLDLTVSTQEEINVGDIVVLEGVIATDKDFGSGYRYDIIMEEAIRK